MNTPSTPTIKADAFIGIDFHKRYSVYHAIDNEGRDLAKGRIEHEAPHEGSGEAGQSAILDRAALLEDP